ncbi:MAG: DpnD/PcfM family protein [Oscillospiraceae bacterium]
MKRKFIVTIEETLSDTYEVYADDAKQAGMIAEEKYKSGEYVLEPGNLLSKKMMVEDPCNDECADWIEF